MSGLTAPRRRATAIGDTPPRTFRLHAFVLGQPRNPSLTQTEKRKCYNALYEKVTSAPMDAASCDSNCDHSLETADPKTCNYYHERGGCYSSCRRI